MGSEDKIILYTNHRCPWAHRAHITLAELNLPFEEVIIDLDVPRTAEYLAVNPRGLVPSISFNGEIITESAIVAQFLVDSRPNHLVPQTGNAEAALRRARIAFFVDAFISGSTKHLFKIAAAKTDAEAEEPAREALQQLVKEVEPLLADAKPFFGGSDKLTFAEVLTAPFAIRLLTLSKAGVYPKILAEQLPEKAPNFTKWAEKLSSHQSVVNIYREEDIIRTAKARIAKLRAA